jgi:hypothetical protein
MVTLAFIIDYKKSCWNLFPPSEKVSEIAEAKLYIVSSFIYLLYPMIEKLI